MDLENIFIREVIYMKASGLTINHTERERPSTPKVALTLVITKMETCMERGNTSGLTGLSIKANSKIIILTDTASTNG